MTSDSAVAALALKGPLPSSELQKELVENFGLRRYAAIKLIERSKAEGKIRRFIRLKSGGYIYYLEKVHSTALIRCAAKRYIPYHRPKLSRLINVIDKVNVISIYELCRLTNLKHDQKGNINPKLLKLIDELSLFEITKNANYLVSPLVERSKIDQFIVEAEARIESEARLLYIVRNKFLKDRLAKEFYLNRTPNEQSLLLKFDATGKCGFKTKAEMVFEIYTRRSVLIEDLVGYQERIWSSITKGEFSKPLFCFVIAASFEDDALNFALTNKMRPILMNEKLELTPIYKSGQVTKKRIGLHGRLADAQGLAFESLVERVLRGEGYETDVRKKIYLLGDKLTWEKNKRVFTDIDVYARKGNSEILLIECKSSKRQIRRDILMQKMEGIVKVAEFVLNSSETKPKISIIFIGKCNPVDAIDAKRVSACFTTVFITPNDFGKSHQEQLKGEPGWLCS